MPEEKSNASSSVGHVRNPAGGSGPGGGGGTGPGGGGGTGPGGGDGGTGGGLPITGQAVGLIALAGVSLLVAGGLGLASARRRRTRFVA